MIHLYIEATVFAMVLSLPIGVGTIAMLKNGINHGSLYPFLTGLGFNVIDVTMMLIYYFGFSNLLLIDEVQLVFRIVGVVALCLLGVKNIKGAKISFGDGEASNKTVFKAMLDGFLAALMPSSLTYWILVIGSFLIPTLESGATYLTACIGLLSGFMLYNLFLSLVAMFINKFLSDKVIYYVNIASGLFFFGFAIYFLLNW